MTRPGSSEMRSTGEKQKHSRNLEEKSIFKLLSSSGSETGSDSESDFVLSHSSACDNVPDNSNGRLLEHRLWCCMEECDFDTVH
jgi:hypothetical protein